MKNLWIVVLFCSVSMLQAQKKKMQPHKFDFEQTTWQVVKITSLDYSDQGEARPSVIKINAFGEWNAFVKLRFEADKNFTGTRLNGVEFTGKAEVFKEKKKFLLHYNFKEMGYENAVDADITLDNDRSMTLTADFCNDACVYTLEYKRIH